MRLERGSFAEHVEGGLQLTTLVQVPIVWARTTTQHAILYSTPLPADNDLVNCHGQRACIEREAYGYSGRRVCPCANQVVVGRVALRRRG